MKNFFNSFRYAFKGILLYIREGGNIAVHLSCCLVVITAAYFLNVSLIEWCLLILCMGCVLTAEAFNTAIEKIINFICPDFDKTAGNIKDMSAGAVLIIAIASLFIGLIIFIPKLLSLF